MPTLDSYLFFDGRCAEAMRFYERTLGARMDMLMTYAQSPDPAACPPGDKDRVMHAAIVLPDGRRLMASDSPAGMHRPMGGFALALNYPTADEARKVFDVLAAGGLGDDADGQDLLDRSLRHAHRPLRHALDGGRRRAGGRLSRSLSRKLPTAAPSYDAAARLG